MQILKEFDYMVIQKILSGDGFKPVSTTEYFETKGDRTVFHKEIVLPSPSPSPEELLIKSQSFDQLSIEARCIIIIIANASEEFIELFKTPQRALLSKILFKKCLIESWKSKILIENIWKEIQQWVNENLQ